ncbi:hypothetical protein FFA01_02010 [Frigoribacterium faeni]|uniref:Uncharacterized protein n=1 Tax=Frigoribacterium faeni TaxID=145483 RepID=A0ABQ0UK68_9MICO|nr:hypothetical protein GCM10025699_47640 [Microbacterium flavescens]GEK81892.1 hypothetical protein FFA01_02010 [Frigoribacterium faeni]
MLRAAATADASRAERAVRVMGMVSSGVRGAGGPWVPTRRVDRGGHILEHRVGPAEAQDAMLRHRASRGVTTASCSADGPLA